jgi:biotin synthase
VTTPPPDSAIAGTAPAPRTRAELEAVYALPLPDLLYRAQTVHRTHHDPNVVQLSTLSNIKQGGCPEDCAYCPQAARYDAGVEAAPLLDAATVRHQAVAAKDGGSTRFCMGAAWRDVPTDERFQEVLGLVREVSDLGMEVCCTLGMVTESQAVELRDAGCNVYNHNLDTSREYYGEIISTRTYDDRLNTLAAVRKAGLEVCCGGILGMGESTNDRIGLLEQLAALEPHPESVPINSLVAVEGTPLGEGGAKAEAKAIGGVDPIELVRTIATARIAMPTTAVRLSAGRREMSRELQAMCFFAGANSIFTGDKLLTTPNPCHNDDLDMLSSFGMRPQTL